MTQEDKAKRYDEAIERARGFVCKEYVEVAEYIFPELKESEDEKIREALIKLVKKAGEGYENVIDGVSIENAISWLEKQGEQKPADKVEPFDKCEGLTDFERTLADICIGWIGEEHGWKQYIKDNADVLLKIAIEKFNSVQDAPFEQKPAWSEEDENLFEEIKRCIGIQYPLGNPCIFKFLKSLKERYTWKPSDEQIRRLEYFLKLWGKTEDIENTKVFETVKSLLNDLKKLKD